MNAGCGSLDCLQITAADSVCVSLNVYSVSLLAEFGRHRQAANDCRGRFDLQTGSAVAECSVLSKNVDRRNIFFFQKGLMVFVKCAFLF
jgi:hypothetical protein